MYVVVTSWAIHSHISMHPHGTNRVIISDVCVMSWDITEEELWWLIPGSTWWHSAVMCLSPHCTRCHCVIRRVESQGADG